MSKKVTEPTRADYETARRYLAPIDPDDVASIEINLSERDCALLHEAADLLTAEAGEELMEAPLRAGLRQWVAIFLLQAVTRREIALAHPVGVSAGKSRPPAKPAATKKAEAMKVKHVYDLSDGLCHMDHGQGPCLLARIRKPRAGSPAAKATAAADSTGDLLARTHGKNGTPELPTIPAIATDERDPS